MRFAVGPRHGQVRSRSTKLTSRWLSVLLAIVLLSGTLASSPAAAAQATEPFATASVVPQDVVSYTVVPLREDSAQWTRVLALLERAGLGPALQQLGDEALGNESESLPFEMFLGGEVAITLSQVAIDLLVEETMAAAVAPPGAADAAADEAISETGLAVVATADAPGFIELSLQDALVDTADGVGTEVERTEHAGTAIEYVSVPAGSNETPLAVARVDDFILAAAYPADLEPFLETAAGEREPLSELEAFAQVQAALDQEHLAFGFVNSLSSEGLEAALQSAGLPGQAIAGEAPPSGFLLTANELGFGLETVTLGTGAGGDTGSAFPEPQLLTQTPSDVLLFFAGTDLAGSGLLDVLGVLLLSASGLTGVPPDAESLDDILDAQFEQLSALIGVNLRTDLLQQLTGDYGFWLKLPSPIGAISALFASGVADPAVVSSALFQVTLLVQSAGSGQMSVISRPVGEESRVFAVETGDPIVPRVEYGVVGEQLVVGLGDAVDNVGEAPESPLTENESFQTLMAALPDASGGILYVDLEQALPLLTAAAQSADSGALSTAATVSSAASPAATAADDHPDCERYASRAEAQAAYDTFAPGSFQLDGDFDGEACEDFFASTEDAAPAGTVAEDQTSEEMGLAIDPEALAAFTAFGMVAYEDEGDSRTSALLLVVDADEPDE